jgi:hypothetical protein
VFWYRFSGKRAATASIGLSQNASDVSSDSFLVFCLAGRISLEDNFDIGSIRISFSHICTAELA